MSGIQDAQTVAVRVQVIDLVPVTLDLVLPTYIPAKDLTQRIARDAGLGAYWEDGTRRQFWLRARGRVLGDDERLQDLGVGSGELLHVLPQPPDATIQERPPEYPPNKGYPGAGWFNVIGGLLSLLVLTGAWALALMSTRCVMIGLIPGIGLAVLCTSFSRHVWGGPGSAFKIPILGAVIYYMMWVIAAIPAVVLSQVDPKELAVSLVPAAIIGLAGVLLCWLAWYGAVEPLPKRVVAQAAAAAAPQAIACAICNMPVTAEVRADCVFQCGRVFHSGCYRARQGAAGNSQCAICGFKPA